MTGLPRSTPAAQGVDARGIDAFVASLAPMPDVELHSLMVLRHGHVVAERFWWPYRPEAPQLLYSLSKSFAATAQGFAVAEGLVDLDATVLSCFPEHDARVTDPRCRSSRRTAGGPIWWAAPWATRGCTCPPRRSPGSGSSTSTAAAGRAGSCCPRSGSPRPPAGTWRPVRTMPTGTRVTASSSGAAGTATAATARSGSSWWSCRRPTRSSRSPRRARTCRASWTGCGSTCCPRSPRTPVRPDRGRTNRPSWPARPAGDGGGGPLAAATYRPGPDNAVPQLTTVHTRPGEVIAGTADGRELTVPLGAPDAWTVAGPLATAYAWSAGVLLVDVIFVESPHRLHLALDPAAGTCTARWQAEPIDDVRPGAHGMLR